MSQLPAANCSESLQILSERFVQEITQLLKSSAHFPQSIPSVQKAKHPTASAHNAELAGRIDHTLLRPEATREEVARYCDEARQFGFAAVCVSSRFVGWAAELLQGAHSLPISVVGFPHGNASKASKVFETRQAVRDGAREIDMVVPLGALREKDYTQVFEEIQAVVEAALPFPVKVILETAQLTQEEKIMGCALSQAAGGAFVKTSTGFGSGGATVDDVRLIRQIVGPGMGVKASGGIRTYEDAMKMIAAGANRIGASSSVAIVTAGHGSV